jgi:hypothetical protein
MSINTAALLLKRDSVLNQQPLIHCNFRLQAINAPCALTITVVVSSVMESAELSPDTMIGIFVMTRCCAVALKIA